MIIEKKIYTISDMRHDLYTTINIMNRFFNNRDIDIKKIWFSIKRGVCTVNIEGRISIKPISMCIYKNNGKIVSVHRIVNITYEKILHPYLSDELTDELLSEIEKHFNN